MPATGRDFAESCCRHVSLVIIVTMKAERLTDEAELVAKRSESAPRWLSGVSCSKGLDRGVCLLVPQQ